MMSCCLIILNYNGKAHLDDCLTSALTASRETGVACPVILVDNRSTQDDVEYVRNHFPEVEIIVAKENDCLFSLNPIVSSRTEDIVVILNNDMRFEKGFIPPLLKHFSDPDVFAVTAKVMNWEGTRVTTGKRMGDFRHGWFYKHWDYGIQQTCLTLDAGGGCAAFRRQMFVELGGFDTLYRPAYYEDMDLSYRAWQRSWKILYEPASVIYHKIGATLNDVQGRSHVSRLICRNEVLFTIKNCKGYLFLCGYLLLLPVRLLRNGVAGNQPLTGGIVDALVKIPAALSRRIAQGKLKKVRDRDFLQQIKHGAAL